MIFNHKHFFKMHYYNVIDDDVFSANRIYVRGECTDCGKELMLGMLLVYDKEVIDHIKYIKALNTYRLEFDAFYHERRYND